MKGSGAAGTATIVEHRRDKKRIGEVADALRQEIVQGKLAIGDRLPTEDALCARFSIGRHTARQAVKVLRDDGLVASRQGAGTSVIARQVQEPFFLEGQSIDDLLAYSAEVYAQVLSAKLERIDDEQAEIIGATAGEDWLVVDCLVRSRTDDHPVCASQYFIHRDFAAVAERIPQRAGPILPILEDMFAIRVGELDQLAVGSTIDPRLAEELGLPADGPAIDIRRTYRCAGGRVAQISIHKHPLAGFRLSIRLQRSRG